MFNRSHNLFLFWFKKRNILLQSCFIPVGSTLIIKNTNLNKLIRKIRVFVRLTNEMLFMLSLMAYILSKKRQKSNLHVQYKAGNQFISWNWRLQYIASLAHHELLEMGVASIFVLTGRNLGLKRGEFWIKSLKLSLKKRDFRKIREIQWNDEIDEGKCGSLREKCIFEKRALQFVKR